MRYPKYRIDIYYKTPKGKKQPSYNEKAYIIVFYRGEIYTAKDDPIIKQFYDLKGLFENRREGDGYSWATQMIMAELNEQNCWYAFTNIRSYPDVNYLIKNYFRKYYVVDECQVARRVLYKAERDLEKNEMEKNQIRFAKKHNGDNSNE